MDCPGCRDRNSQCGSCVEKDIDFDVGLYMAAQVLQRDLPRPKTLDSLPTVRSQEALQQMSLKESAEALLQNEMLLLLQHDAAKYPIKVAPLFLFGKVFQFLCRKALSLAEPVCLWKLWLLRTHQAIAQHQQDMLLTLSS